jgi:hypothetical protein
MHFRDGEVMTVPLVDSIDPVTFQYSSIYNVGTRPIGTWEWGLLYKVPGIREEEFFICCWILLEGSSLQFRSLGVSSFGPGQCLGHLRVGLGRQLRESVS